MKRVIAAKNAASLMSVISEISALLGRRVKHSHADWRLGDQRWFVADTRAARAALGFEPRIGWRDGLASLVTELAGDRPRPARFERAVIEEPAQGITL